MRIRITFSKTGAMRYIGHLDLQVIWERTARRAGLPLAYTQGFHPGPRIQIACALPLGFSGRQELVDLWLKDAPAPGEPAGATLQVTSDSTVMVFQAEAPARRCIDLLQAAAPPGIDILRVERIEDHAPALQARVSAADYLVTLLEPGSVVPLAEKVEHMLGTASLPRERRGKPYDLRPLVLCLEIVKTGSLAPALHMLLSAREGATGRPEEVLAVLGVPLEQVRIERTRLLFAEDAATTSTTSDHHGSRSL